MHPNATDPMQLSADQVPAIPVPPHLRGYELENGELVAVSLPAPLHGRLVAEVLFRIKLHLRDNPGVGRAYGEVGYVLDLPDDPERLRGPDVSFVSEQRIRSAGGEPGHESLVARGDDPPAREMDMLLSTGEQVSVALMAMAIHSLGAEAVSLTGGQIGIRTDSTHTNAKIVELRPDRNFTRQEPLMTDLISRHRDVIAPVIGFDTEIHAVKGDGIWITDTDGRRYADFACGIAVTNLGHNHPVVVAAAHAGWRGLCAGVIEATLAAMAVAPGRVLAWLGPAIGPSAYEVGPEVRSAFVERDAQAAEAFTANGGRWLLDLYAVARQRLAAQGVTRVFGGGFCTYSDPGRFYSYRRSRDAARMAAAIWLT